MRASVDDRETASEIIANSATFGWNVAALAKKKLFFLDARLSPDVVRAGAFDLGANRWQNDYVAPPGWLAIERVYLDGALPVWRWERDAPCCFRK